MQEKIDDDKRDGAIGHDSGLGADASFAATKPSIASLAVPSILSNLSYSLVGMVQTKFIGEFGAEGLAALGAGQRIFFAMQAVLMAVSAGTTALVARAWGAGDYEEASRVTMASLVLAGILGVLIAVFGFFLAHPVAGIFGLSPESVNLAARNIQWLSFFNLAFAIFFIFSASLRASGDAWTPLWTGIGTNILNLPLAYALVFGAWGFARMEVAGVAVAAGIAFSISSVVLLVMWVKQKFRITHTRGGWWRRARLKSLLDIGYPAAVEQGVFQLGFFVFLMLIGRVFGTEAFAAYNIGVNILSLCMTVGFGFSIAGSILSVSTWVPRTQRCGEKWMAVYDIRCVITMGSMGLTIILLCPYELSRYFIGDNELTITYTVQFIYLLGSNDAFDGSRICHRRSALRGAGDTRFPLIATILGLIVMRCGFASIAVYLGLDVFWVYAALVGDYMLKSLLLIWRFRKGRWKTLVPSPNYM